MFLRFISILLLFCNIRGIPMNEIGPFVQTPLGGVIGTYQRSPNNKKYEAYEGIPYALPPTEQRRFEPPSPTGKWTNNITATSLAAPCIQYEHLSHSYVGDRVSGKEDCLYLNVYVPFKSKSLPVVFVIHGGNFHYGRVPRSTRFWMDRDVIVVSINYRVGMFGFLSTEDSVVPGNMGLKDQSLALRWIYENIQYFGGDHNRITLIGVSSGAASVHYHYLSPMSKGLFQNGISMSGTAFAPSKHAENSLEKAKKLAAILDCGTDDNSDMVRCLKNRPAYLMVNATRHFQPWLYFPTNVFGPVVETSSAEPFINRSAIDIISSGDAYDVLWITSNCAREGLYPAADFINDEKLLDYLDKHWESIAPHLLDYNYTIPLKDQAEVSRRIRKHYFGSKPISRDTVQEIVDVVGDRLHTYDAYKSAVLQAKTNKSPVLYMRYNYRALTSFSDRFSASRNNYGVSHSDDYFTMFDYGIIDATQRPADRAMQNKLMDLVVSVATNRYPVLGLDFEWKRVNPDKEELDFLLVNSPTDIQMASDDNIGQWKFWETIDFDENKLK